LLLHVSAYIYVSNVHALLRVNDLVDMHGVHSIKIIALIQNISTVNARSTKQTSQFLWITDRNKDLIHSAFQFTVYKYYHIHCPLISSLIVSDSSV